MCVNLVGVKEIKYNGDKLNISPHHDPEINEKFWRSVMHTVLDGDSECVSEQMVEVNPGSAILLFAALAEELQKQDDLELMHVTKKQQEAVKFMFAHVAGCEDI